jgi:ABC-type nitrate/sulfonate/bicarbonate transport system substrate-binding protein
VVRVFAPGALYVAQQRGLFAAQGLHVKIVPSITSSTSIADQLAGKFGMLQVGFQVTPMLR